MSFRKPTDEEYAEMTHFEQVAYNREKLLDMLKRIRQCMPPMFPYEGWEKDYKTLKDWQLDMHRRTCMDIADILEEIDI